MTNDELLYAANETIAQLEEYRVAILERQRGKVVKGYAHKVFSVDDVVIQHGDVWVFGFVLKKDGSQGVRRYGVTLDSAEFA